MQRFFSMFPNGWPGAGLLILRAAAAVPLLLCNDSQSLGIGPPATYVVQFVMVVTGILLLVGLWTPIAATLAAILEVWILVSQRGNPSIHYMLAALCVSLAMLGPGAWSIDARLFGRKRIDIRP